MKLAPFLMVFSTFPEQVKLWAVLRNHTNKTILGLKSALTAVIASYTAHIRHKSDPVGTAPEFASFERGGRQKGN